MRAILHLLVCLLLTACFDFEAELRECDAGRGACARDGGPSTGDGGSVADGGSTRRRDGGTLVRDDGGVDCAADSAATQLTPDGSIAFCFNGFTWENPLPQGSTLGAVWGGAPDDVWVGGAAGLLMNWDGARWFSSQGEPGHDGTAPRLGSVTAFSSSPGGVWLAGIDVTPRRLGPDGEWMRTTAPPGSGPPWRIAALAVSPDGTRGPFAVTSNGAVLRVPDWEQVSAGPGTDFVRAAAVGNDGLVALSGTFLNGSTSEHRVWNIDGGFWTFDAGEPGALWMENGQLLVASTNRDVPLLTLWALDPSGNKTQRASLGEDLVLTAAAFVPELDAGFLVGSNATVTDLHGRKQMSATLDHELRAVWASAGGAGWAVGVGGALLQRDQTRWVSRQNGFAEDQYGIWLSDDGGVFFAGRGSLLTERATGVRRVLGTGTLRALHRNSDGSWLVASESGGLYRGQAGGSSTTVYPGRGNNNSLTDLLVDEDEAWATGINTTVHRQGDGGWAEVTPPVDGQEWWKIARAGSRFLFAGSQGLVGVYALDAGWAAAVPEATGSTFYGVWTIDADAGTAWVVGGGPTVVLFHASDGTFDAPVDLPQSVYGALFDVWGSAPDDVWAVGDEGLAFHYDGAAWTLVETGTRNKLERVRSRPRPGGGRELIIVGEKGTVLRKRY